MRSVGRDRSGLGSTFASRAAPLLRPGAGCLTEPNTPYRTFFQETGQTTMEQTNMDQTHAAQSSHLPDPNDLMTPSDAARVLGLSADSVRVLSDSGRLPAMRTVSGRRLFRRSDVDRLAAERAQHLAATIAFKAAADGR